MQRSRAHRGVLAPLVALSIVLAAWTALVAPVVAAEPNVDGFRGSPPTSGSSATHPPTTGRANSLARAAIAC